MTERVLVAIGPSDVGERQVFNTGLSTIGRGGDDWLCGHCGHKMLADFNLERMEVDMVFQCGSCGGHNVRPATDPDAATAEDATPDNAGNDNAEG